MLKTIYLFLSSKTLLAVILVIGIISSPPHLCWGMMSGDDEEDQKITEKILQLPSHQHCTDFLPLLDLSL